MFISLIFMIKYHDNDFIYHISLVLNTSEFSQTLCICLLKTFKISSETNFVCIKVTALIKFYESMLNNTVSVF